MSEHEQYDVHWLYEPPSEAESLAVRTALACALVPLKSVYRETPAGEVLLATFASAADLERSLEAGAWHPAEALRWLQAHLVSMSQAAAFAVADLVKPGHVAVAVGYYAGPAEWAGHELRGCVLHVRADKWQDGSSAQVVTGAWLAVLGSLVCPPVSQVGRSLSSVLNDVCALCGEPASAGVRCAGCELLHYCSEGCRDLHRAAEGGHCAVRCRAAARVRQVLPRTPAELPPVAPLEPRPRLEALTREGRPLALEPWGALNDHRACWLLWDAARGGAEAARAVPGCVGRLRGWHLYEGGGADGCAPFPAPFLDARVAALDAWPAWWDGAGPPQQQQRAAVLLDLPAGRLRVTLDRRLPDGGVRLGDLLDAVHGALSLPEGRSACGGQPPPCLRLDWMLRRGNGQCLLLTGDSHCMYVPDPRGPSPAHVPIVRRPGGGGGGAYGELDTRAMLELRRRREAALRELQRAATELRAPYGKPPQKQQHQHQQRVTASLDPYGS